MRRALSVATALTVVMALGWAACGGDSASRDRARSVAPPKIDVQKARTETSRQVTANLEGYREGRRRALAEELVRAQADGPDTFRSQTWGQLALVTVLGLVVGFFARLFMSLKMPSWWPWRRRVEADTPAPPPRSDADRPLWLVLWSRSWSGARTWAGRVGNVLVGPAPRDHVWRQEIHQSRDAERDLVAAAKAAAELPSPGSPETPAVGESPEADEDDTAEGAGGEETASAETPPAAVAGDPVLIDALNAWRSEIASARRSLENLEPLEHRRELLAALDKTQEAAAELRVTFTRAVIVGQPVDHGTLDYWRRIVSNRPTLAHLTPKGESPDGEKGWGHGAAVLALTACALGIFCVAAWAAAGALPLVFGLGFGIGGAVTYAVARVQLDRTGRPRLLPGVADRLATRVATAALLIALAAWGSLMFGDDTNLGIPPRLEMPDELRLPAVTATRGSFE